MADREIVESQDACAIPKWAPRKGLRYEVDDFIVSPPSTEEGGFFQLRYGRRSKPRASTYDRINQELSMTVEIKDGDPVISDLTLSGLEKESVTPEIAITPTGLSLSKLPEAKPETSSSRSTKPLFVFHLKDSKQEGDCTEDSVKRKISSGIIPPSPEIVEELKEAVLKDKEHSSSSISSLIGEDNEKTENHKAAVVYQKVEVPQSNVKQDLHLDVALVEKVQNLQVSPVQVSPQQMSPFATPLTTPQSSPVTKRKVSGVVMDQSKNSYFCTKPFQPSQQLTNSDLSATSASRGQQLEDYARTAASMDPNQKMMGKKRKPKPSSLREMNFWAPTSM